MKPPHRQDRATGCALMQQLVFDLARPGAFGRADFLVSDSNLAALRWVERWPQWPSPALLVHGPTGAGKTHLAHLWRDYASAELLDGARLTPAAVADIFEKGLPRIAIDDADGAPEAALLHVFNACIEAGGSLLLTARGAPGTWRPALADLGSRLRAAPAVAIDLPDDRLLGAVLAKHFADRQVRVLPEVIAYLVRRMERSLAAAGDIAAALDRAALIRNGPITIPLAGEVLAGLYQPFPPGNDAGVT